MSELNPYAAPQEVNVRVEPPARVRAVNLLRGPSLAFFLLAWFHVLITTGLMTMVLIDLVDKVRGGNRRGWPPPVMFVPLAAIPGCALLIVAGWRMRRLQSLWLCRAGALVACLPYLSPLICCTIPFGLWGLIVLFLPSVAREFDQLESSAPNHFDT